MRKLLVTITIILCISLSGCHNKKSTNDTMKTTNELSIGLKAQLEEVNKITQNNMKTREQLLAEFAKLNADVKVAMEAELAQAKKDRQIMNEDSNVN